MNNKQHQEIVKGAVKSKFHGHTALKSKTIPKYPSTAEREFQRITSGYMKLLNKSLKSRLPKIMEAYKRERHGDSRYDDSRDLDRDVREELMKVAEELETQLSKYGLEDMIEGISKMTKNNSVREWKRAVKDTLGIDILGDYYEGAFYGDALKKWVSDNVSKIKSIPNESLGSMRQIILDSFIEGKPIRDIEREIQSEYNITKSKARMLARDQVSTLNSQITQMQQKDAGCSKYRWSTSKDSRVRDCHRDLDGKTFSWDDPPEMWYNTKAGVVYTGRHCHPGEDYCCRCVAVPVFELDTLNIPMAGDSK